ncbi:sirohydrochlorin ferrochelatase [Streptomyces netropsis]|uniref:Sirohydrochlorin ferrochelatase n=1 Tax=Streptomyces netropsis TaxID=55404 RepID=A0A7W7PIA2_STRNE|nr:sirohydrochlorin chelatase [Streptomyces netropsis]MBB4889580.1 sirohydrochlorin ferrochelatase [Streptomyces netropsis]
MTAGRAARTPVLVAVAHGTRDPAGVRTVRQLLDQVRGLRPGLRVRAGFLGHADPGLAETLDDLRGTPVVVPLLLGTGYHVRTDIPAALAAAGFGRAPVARVLGPDPLLATALGDRLREAGWPGTARGGAVVLAAAGSRDPAANAATAEAARLLGVRLGCPVLPSYLGGASPTPAEAVVALRARGHRCTAVAPYLLAPGFFARRAADCGANITCAPLGAHETVARLVLRRYDEACFRAVPLVTPGRSPGRPPRTAAHPR